MFFYRWWINCLTGSEQRFLPASGRDRAIGFCFDMARSRASNQRYLIFLAFVLVKLTVHVLNQRHMHGTSRVGQTNGISFFSRSSNQRY